MPDAESTFKIFDDCGMLSLVDCASYVSFVSSDWTLESLFDHFTQQMQRRAMFVWHCGDGGGPYSVCVRRRITNQPGYRETTGAIISTTDRLYLVSYDALTMAAQFDSERLPSEEERDLAIVLPPGKYKLRIVQTFDPEIIAEAPAPHFLIEIETGEVPQLDAPAWTDGLRAS